MTAEEIVRAEIAAWGNNDVDEVMNHFADDATFDIGPDWPKLSGRDAIHEMMKVFFAGGKCVNLEIRYLAVDGNVVLMGAYEVRDEKITAWREYFYPPKES